MDAKAKILAYLARRPSASGGELRRHLAISRQALAAHLRRLAESGKIARTGTTRGARYSLPHRVPPARVVSRTLRTRGLDEGRVWDDVALRLNVRRALRPNVEAIVRYAFTEMLNNAIEHSEAARCTVRVSLESAGVRFAVRDPGIGVFHSIATKLHLSDEEQALVELLKGKTTTMAASHAGEGLFFTSRAADRLLLRSHRIQVEWDRAKQDVFVSTPRYRKGTDVQFVVRRSTPRKLEDVFREYAPAEYDFQFQKTTMLVKLLRRDYVSRSEARRLLANLEKFREIVLDFKDVRSVGQAFADEVFRVFARRHPAIIVRTANTTAAVDAMIRHVSTS